MFKSKDHWARDTAPTAHGFDSFQLQKPYLPAPLAVISISDIYGSLSEPQIDLIRSRDTGEQRAMEDLFCLDYEIWSYNSNLKKGTTDI